jgi:sarcosine oxidase subunit delta
MRITCPFCGPRDEAEFAYRGDATAPDGELYIRDNPKGWHEEWFQHALGCRQWLRVRRHTVTHEIASVTPAMVR